MTADPPDWPDQLAREIDQRDRRHLRRTLRPVDRCGRLGRCAGRELINFASNDYLALAGDARLATAVADAARRLGVGAGASRLIAGHTDATAALEARFAQFKHAEAALVCPTGYMANHAGVTSLVGAGDRVFIDKLVHASLIDAARASGATLRVFPHLGYAKLERLLAGAQAESRRMLILTDTVFSMDGDTADLPALCELRDRYGAILLADEAHATGVLGPTGAGLAELQGVAGHIDVTVSTASKALGSLGGIITASRLVIDTIINNARSFIYTTAVPPTQIAAIDAALDVVRDEPRRRQRLVELNTALRGGLINRGWHVPVAALATPIVPVVIGDADRAMALSDRLFQVGLGVPAVRPPTVAPGSSRLRISLRADHTDADVATLVDAMGSI